MRTIQTLRKKRVAKEKISVDFNNTIASLKYIKDSKFIFNNFVINKNNDYVCIVENNDEIILILDNYDTLDIKPRKISITKNGTFRSQYLADKLSEQVLGLNDNTTFVLEEVQMNGNFIGYFIKDSLTSNSQPTQANN